MPSGPSGRIEHLRKVNFDIEHLRKVNFDDEAELLDSSAALKDPSDQVL